MNGKGRRDKGKYYEIKIVNELKELFYPKAVSSRSESKRNDDLLKDIMYTGEFCIQCKAVERFAAYSQTLTDMKRNFPDEIPLIFHKRNHKPETVTLLKKDFYKLTKESTITFHG